MNRIRLAILLCAVAGYWLTSFTLPLRPVNDRPIRTVIIDAGHGGKDPGAIGSRHYEKTVNLKVALQLQTLIKSQMPGVQPIMTRNTDHFVALHDRGKIAQDHDGDFFI
ncbi:MAG: N-acetylmuramoyl-L-alanine amidase, partial [Bacteroidota bacterium]